MGMPSSRLRYTGLEVKGWRMAVVWPSPLVTPTATPGMWPRLCCGWVGPEISMSSSPMTPTAAGVSARLSASRVPVTVTASSRRASSASPLPAATHNPPATQELTKHFFPCPPSLPFSDRDYPGHGAAPKCDTESHPGENPAEQGASAVTAIWTAFGYNTGTVEGAPTALITASST